MSIVSLSRVFFQPLDIDFICSKYYLVNNSKGEYGEQDSDDRWSYFYQGMS